MNIDVNDVTTNEHYKTQNGIGLNLLIIDT